MIDALIGGLIALMATTGVALLAELATNMESTSRQRLEDSSLPLSQLDKSAISQFKSGYPPGTIADLSITEWLKKEL